METHRDITIVGGGLNGTTLALALAQAGFSVALIDALPAQTRAQDGFDGRAYALALGGQRVLQTLGLWGDLADAAQPILDIKVTDGRVGQGPSPFWMHFDHGEIEEGPMGYMVQDRPLRHALLQAVAASERITHLAGVEVQRQETQTGNIQAHFDTGDSMVSQLLIGADGPRGGTCTRAGIKRMGWDYAQRALVCTLAHDLPHNGVAHQFFMPGGPLAILPLSGQRSAVVWSEAEDIARGIEALDDAGFLAALRPRFGDFLGEITLAGPRYSYPLRLSIARSFVAKRVALVGDAAHVVHPIAGQGLNAGLRDVAALAEVLADAARRGEDIGAPPVLARYERWRRFDVTGLALATDAFNRLFSNDNPLLRLGRDLGMGLVSALPSMRRSLIREAAGLTGDLPKLMQGRPL